MVYSVSCHSIGRWLSLVHKYLSSESVKWRPKRVVIDGYYHAPDDVLDVQDGDLRVVNSIHVLRRNARHYSSRRIALVVFDVPLLCDAIGADMLDTVKRLSYAYYTDSRAESVGSTHMPRVKPSVFNPDVIDWSRVPTVLAPPVGLMVPAVVDLVTQSRDTAGIARMFDRVIEWLVATDGVSQLAEILPPKSRISQNFIAVVENNEQYLTSLRQVLVRVLVEATNGPNGKPRRFPYRPMCAKLGVDPADVGFIARYLKSSTRVTGAIDFVELHARRLEARKLAPTKRSVPASGTRRNSGKSMPQIITVDE